MPMLPEPLWPLSGTILSGPSKGKTVNTFSFKTVLQSSSGICLEYCSGIPGHRKHPVTNGPYQCGREEGVAV